MFFVWLLLVATIIIAVNSNINYSTIIINITNTTNVTLIDSDGDGIFDWGDNCPNVINPDQNDLDGDGVGNACDNCWYAVNPGQEDSDNDCPIIIIINQSTILPYISDPHCSDVCDNCPDVFNPSQKDSDGDSIGDACEVIMGGIT